MSYLAIVLAAYVVGVIFPIQRLLPTINPLGPKVSSYECYALVVNILLALFTLLTVIVALFKEEIVSLWRKPQLNIDENSLELEEHLGQESKDSPSFANEYTAKFTISNKKNIVAQDVKITITAIKFTNHQTGTTSSIKLETKDFVFSEEKNITKFNPLEIKFFSLTREVTTQGKTGSGQVSVELFKMKIGENEILDDYLNGELEFCFMVFCSNCSIEKSISIKWDKKWKDRKTDMSPEHLLINFKGVKR